MINFAVLNIKGIIQKIGELFIVIIILLMVTIFFLDNKNYIDKFNDTFKLYGIIQISNIDNIKFNLKKELYYLDNFNNEIEINKNEVKGNSKENNKNVKYYKDNNVYANLEKYSYNPEKNVSYDIKNYTDYDINIEAVLDEEFNVKKERKDYTILVIHTHGSESYTGVEHTDYYRTEDTNFNMIRIGDELVELLSSMGYNAIHERSLFDYPGYNGSYTRALECIEKYKEDNNIDIVLDIHRDALSSDPDYAPVLEINNEEASKIMIIVGTDEGGLEHKNWRENLKFASHLYDKGKNMFGDIFRPLYITSSRYNQHTTMKSLILEVGATGNTLEQSINSMKYLAKILDETLIEE